MNRMTEKYEAEPAGGSAVAHLSGSNLATAATKQSAVPQTTDASAPFREYLHAGAKPRSEWRCGAELELFGFAAESKQRLDHRQIQQLIEALAAGPGAHTFDGTVFAGATLSDGGNLTVEPGGQLEYSTAPHRKLADVERDLVAYLSHLSEAASARDFQFLALGFDPMRKIEEQKWFPKPRYDIMRPYLAGRGTAAWDMMTRTCATQVSLDFSSDEDLVRKFVAGNRLAPFVTAMFANSPFADGRVSGFKSTRARAWLDTDPDRCGIPELAWAEGFGIDDFIEYAINVPMLFRRRAGGYLNDVTGVPFRTYLQTQTGPAELLAADWADHLTTLFTEARIKQLIELRSMDCGSLAMVMAAQALWKGLLYDAEALAECERRLPDLSPAGTLELQFEAARVGLQAASDGTDVLSLARDLVLLATGGLQRIAPDEVKYLDILHQQVIEDAVCPADILLRNWHGSWHGSMVRLFAYVSVA